MIDSKIEGGVYVEGSAIEIQDAIVLKLARIFCS